MASFLDSLMGIIGGQNPYSSGINTLGQLPSQYQNFFQPYISTGQQQLNPLSDQYSQLMQDPTAMMNQIGSTYQASPGYQYNVDQATQGAMNAGAASGQAGSPAVQEALAKQIAGLSSQDYNQYMNQALGQYGTGLQGSQQLAGMGLQAGSTDAQLMQQAAMQQALMQALGQASQSSSLGNLLGGITGMFT